VGYNKGKGYVMKRFILLLFLVTPAYASVEMCNYEYCIDWPEYCVQSIETTATPSYGVYVYVNNHKTFVPSTTADMATLMLRQGYESLKDYYKWPQHYYDEIIKQQNKANLGVN
jgi:hypothetical protein